jgi:hypothetical protein
MGGGCSWFSDHALAHQQSTGDIHGSTEFVLAKNPDA